MTVVPLPGRQVKGSEQYYLARRFIASRSLNNPIEGTVFQLGGAYILLQCIPSLSWLGIFIGVIFLISGEMEIRVYRTIKKAGFRIVRGAHLNGPLRFPGHVLAYDEFDGLGTARNGDPEMVVSRSTFKAIIDRQSHAG